MRKNNSIRIRNRYWLSRLFIAPKHFFDLLSIGRGNIAFRSRLRIAVDMTILVLKPNAGAVSPAVPGERQR